MTISAVGDLMLGNTPSLPPDPAGYLSAIAPALRDHADIVFANLEGTITDSTASGKCGGSSGGTCFAFHMPPSYAGVLARAGVTVVNSANNHSHDYGEVGVQDTTAALRRAGIAQTGLPGQIAVVPAGALRVAFVGFAPYPDTSSLLSTAQEDRLIAKAKARADLVVVYMHAGAEGVGASHVTGQEEFYVGEDRGNALAFAHRAIDDGADLVLGSGPHLVRGMEFYRGHLIAYSLGNFVNYHNFGSGGVLAYSAILHVTIDQDGTVRAGQVVPVLLDSAGHGTVGGGAVAEIAALSQADFGRHAARFDADGTLHAPGP